MYADNYTGVHLSEVAKGKTYAQVSTEAMAQPTNTALAAQKSTLLQGEMLRGTLLNAYGWGQFGQYLFLAGIGAAVAGLVILATFVFELVLALSHKPVATSRQLTVSVA